MRVVLGVASALGLGLIGCGSSKPTLAPTLAPTPAPTPAPTLAPTLAPAPEPVPSPAPIIYEPRNVSKAWENHFKAFGDQNVASILLDYDDTSVVSVFNDACSGTEATQINGYAEYVGVEQIRRFFSELFRTLTDPGVNPPGLELPTFNISDNPVVTEFPGANVFLVWKTKDTNVFPKATDTFFWKNPTSPKIMKQNIVFTSPDAECLAFTKPEAPPAGPITKAWKNHFAAFGNQNTTDIMEDYTDSSVINVYDHTTATFTSHEGKTQIASFFDELWTYLTAAAKEDGSLGVKTLVEMVEPEEKSVFLVWQSYSHPRATDSFYFDEQGKIVVQNIVVETTQVMATTTTTTTMATIAVV